MVDMRYYLLDVLFLLLEGWLAVWWVWGVWVWIGLWLFGSVVAVWLCPGFDGRVVWLAIPPGMLAAW